MYMRPQQSTEMPVTALKAADVPYPSAFPGFGPPATVVTTPDIANINNVNSIQGMHSEDYLMELSCEHYYMSPRKDYEKCHMRSNK